MWVVIGELLYVLSSLALSICLIATPCFSDRMLQSIIIKDVDWEHRLEVAHELTVLLNHVLINTEELAEVVIIVHRVQQVLPAQMV